MIRLNKARLVSVLGVLAVALVVIVLFALATGPARLSLAEVFGALVLGEGSDATRDIVLGVRLPRVALGLLVGAALATAGAVFQALLRNPLADPYVLGVSGGAALAGIAVLALGDVIALPTQSVPIPPTKAASGTDCVGSATTLPSAITAIPASAAPPETPST